MPENDTIPTVENMLTEKAGWLYFCPWYGEHILDSSKNDPDTLKSIYQNDYCINLADLPENLYTSYTSSGSSNTDPDTTTEPEPDTTTPSTTEETTEPTDTTTTDTSETTQPDVDTTTEGTSEESPSIGDSDSPSSNLLGDANVDGNILVDDVLLVKKHILGISILEGQGATNADVTLDGDVLANDLLLIKKYVLGIITEF
jgi:mannan endo-1,4-beta-mannosidase